MVMSLPFRWVSAAATGAAVALIAWAYWPGLAGPFLFDDYANLDVLGAYGRLDNWPAFLYYLTSGTADPTGRPVALLTFLLDGSTWPTDPWPFKRTNLALHLLNTALLAYTIARLQAALLRRYSTIRTSPWTPLLAATLWGAHPLFVSTTLYVVQREAMLPMTFVLLALLAWDRAVLRFADGRTIAAWAWAVIGFGGATLLAGLSKANGFLAPLLVGLTYLWLLRPDTNVSTAPANVRTLSASDAHRRQPGMDAAAVLCLGLPSLLLLAYLVQIGWQSWGVTFSTRDWTLPERLLSEPRALWQYVGKLLLPRAGGGGVFVEDFAPSRGWLTPWTTLPAAIALLASVIAAYVLRRRFPIATFAWLFFLTGHLLEGSTIALELYFEHRNYLPAMFLGWPLAHALLQPNAYRGARLALACLLVAGLLLLAHQRAVVWGDEALFNALSAQHQVESPRSQMAAASSEMDRGEATAAIARISALRDRHPQSVSVAINAVSFECQGTGVLTLDSYEWALHALANDRHWNYGLYVWMHDAAASAPLQHCKGFGLDGLTALVAAAESNPRSANPRIRRDLLHVRGRIALATDNPALALRRFNEALAVEPQPDYALVQAGALGDAGAQALGVAHLDFYQQIETRQASQPIRDIAGLHRWLLHHYGYYSGELSLLRQQLQTDAAQNQALPSGD